MIWSGHRCKNHSCRWFGGPGVWRLGVVWFFVLGVATGHAGSVQSETVTQSYLGISTTFGKWNGAIAWVYNPTSAPALFSDSNKVVLLLQEVMAEWSGVSGIQFTYQGIDAAATDVTTDGKVVVYWGNTSGAAAYAGPSRSYSTGSDVTLGYDPYSDGNVVISHAYDWTHSGQLSVTMSENLLKKILLHEVGHLIGLAHSDNPVSMMYANPYNNMPHLMADDIAAAQAYYGPPATLVTAAVYTPPTTTNTIFTNSLLYLNSSGNQVSVSTLTDAVADSDVLNLNLTYAGGFNKNIEIYVVDPFGYVIQEIAKSVTCSASYAWCGSYFGVGYADILKSVSGVYHVYVVSENQLVAHHTFTVATTIAWNRPPNVTLALSATSGIAPLTVSGTVTGSDPENDTISVTWHIPGQGAAAVSGFSGSNTRSMTFTNPGQYVVFVAVNDTGSRYTGSGKSSPTSSAGQGARLVLRQVVTVTSSAFKLDIDGNGKYDALTDGLLVMRYLLGVRGSSLISGVVDTAATRSQATDIEAYLAAGQMVLDVDGDGAVTALVDGQLIVRRLFGFTGAALTSGVVDESKSTAIGTAIQALMP